MEVGITVTCLFCTASSRLARSTEIVVVTVVVAVEVEVAGVTVTTMKLEQSLAREVMSGTLPGRVPVTALAQLLALQVGLL
jgi:hypothetical protein